MLGRLLHYFLDLQSYNSQCGKSNLADGRLLEAICDCYNLDGAAYLKLTAGSSPKLQANHSSSFYPQAQFQQNSNAVYDLIVMISLNETVPFDWRDLEMRRSGMGSSISALQNATGVINGFTIPIREFNETIAIVSVMSRRGNKFWGQQLHQSKTDFICMAHFLHDRYVQGSNDTVAGKENKTELTSRELEALHWSSHGKTSFESAVIMGITKRAVNFHISNAKEKLNAASKAHAVSKAISINIIENVY